MICLSNHVRSIAVIGRDPRTIMGEARAIRDKWQSLAQGNRAVIISPQQSRSGKLFALVELHAITR